MTKPTRRGFLGLLGAIPLAAGAQIKVFDQLEKDEAGELIPGPAYDHKRERGIKVGDILRDLRFHPRTSDAFAPQGLYLVIGIDRKAPHGPYYELKELQIGIATETERRHYLPKNWKEEQPFEYATKNLILNNREIMEQRWQLVGIVQVKDE